MKKLFFAAVAAALTLASCQKQDAKVSPAIPYDQDIENRVEATLSKMTLEEKVGQMTQLVLDLAAHCEADPDGAYGNRFVVDEEKLTALIRDHKIGSFLNQISAQSPTPEQWETVMEPLQRISMQELGIPCLFGLDQNHGTTYTAGGTLFPQNINMGAALNRQMVREAAEICAYETRAGSVTWTFNPTIDLSRNSCWPRVWENFGEDCYVNAELGREATVGFQGEDPNHIDQNHIAACLKHYMGYGVPVSGKDRTPSSIAPAELREKHFAPFYEAIRNGHALSIMVNSGSNNGVPFHANHELLTVWLKEGLNWDGMIVTDWADINNLYTRDHVAADKKQAIAMAINAGIDMAMEPYNTDFCDLLVELVKEGTVPQSRIDDATRRVLRLKYRLGLFDNPVQHAADYPEFASARAAELSKQGAVESEILLKNNGILPLAKGKKILLTGPNANSMRVLHGGWSYTWQGSNTDKYDEQYNTIYEAMCQKYGAKNVILEEGVSYNMSGKYYEELPAQIDRAVRAASQADIIVACIGENSYAETPGNLTDLALSSQQRDLVKALAKTGKPVVMVLSEGRPRLIADIEPLASAIVDILVPGNYGGDALADLLAGDANFSGRLPYTYPKEPHSLITYDYKPCQETATMEGAYDYNAVVDVQWPFGYGLSYTKFAYSNITADKQHFTSKDVLTFTIDVENVGKVAGKESVMLFSSDLVATCTPDVRRLRQFEKIELHPGEKQTVTLSIPATDLAFCDYYGEWLLEAGDFRIQIGDQVVNVTCDETVYLKR
ncbi:MAG: glycoside hydrolase family 3 C-terminal domain-containing protein [Bacteroidales bacterium]|nr:glycoside hydrolase family 3 C-terminal domain-containing protein [Candidatus Liminaster caballi]